MQFSHTFPPHSADRHTQPIPHTELNCQLDSEPGCDALSDALADTIVVADRFANALCYQNSQSIGVTVSESVGESVAIGEPVTKRVLHCLSDPKPGAHALCDGDSNAE